MKIDTAIFIRIESPKYVFTKLTRITFGKKCFINSKNKRILDFSFEFSKFDFFSFEFSKFEYKTFPRSHFLNSCGVSLPVGQSFKNPLYHNWISSAENAVFCLKSFISSGFKWLYFPPIWLKNPFLKWKNWAILDPIQTSVRFLILSNHCSFEGFSILRHGKNEIPSFLFQNAISILSLPAA